MTTFDLELRVTEYGSVLAREIFLEDVTDPNRRVRNWQQGDGFQFKKLQDFVIADSSLEVFVGCQGVSGASVSCEVFINNNSKGEILSRIEDKSYAKGSFNI